MLLWVNVIVTLITHAAITTTLCRLGFLLTHFCAAGRLLTTCRGEVSDAPSTVRSAVPRVVALFSTRRNRAKQIDDLSN